MIEPMHVAAVVVTYNRLPLLQQCLQALDAQTAALAAIWVIDNASTDGTEAAVRGMNLPNLIYRNTGRNLGGAGGFAYGVREAALAGYDALWLMDDDTIPEPEALEKLLQADHELQRSYGWLSSRALAPDGTDQPMNRQRKSPYTDLENYEGATIPSVMASFVSLFLPVAVIREYGLPIAEFFIWSDDWEYTRRISRELPCYVAPNSRVVHAMQNPGTVNIATDAPSRWSRYHYFYRNDVVLYRREGIRGWLWLLAKDLWHTLQVLRDTRGQRFARIATIWKGFWEGVRFFPKISYLP
ncbi:MAG TPA: glycosyltransferase family 2 protein [Candidatus Gemmiger excrementigallinarum]|uniref:Glycosyltransferase family 2 protein n=1 Tax=Candidatus Gemmiger excrementigallinarum TaxID=2838609 RepID=A0A9D2ENZ1_9FIRM|nr:glycosyltransferase family 2 protein [Candidatus Gemmiger excrementigallinarum]